MTYLFKFKLLKIIIRKHINRLTEIVWDNPPIAPPHAN